MRGRCERIAPLALELAGTTYLLLPLLGAALLHGVCMKHGWLAFLARPIDGGRTLRGRPLFGHSKTWRGPILVGIGAGAVFAVQQRVLHSIDAIAAIEVVDYASLPLWFGAAAGAVAELAELPNSFTKRQLGIAPGHTASGPLSILFYLWDQLDLLIGWWLVCAAFVPATPLRVAMSALLVAGVHPLLTGIGYLLGMRPTAR
jgi:CDP-archaeol synthase